MKNKLLLFTVLACLFSAIQAQYWQVAYLNANIDMNREVIQSKSIEMNTGKNQIKFNVRNLPTGIYNVLLFDENNNASVHEVMVTH